MMLRNYIKIALRNLWKNKRFSLINILGLSMGVCAFLLISLYVVDEISYDRYHKKADRIYRINSDINFGGNYMETALATDPLGFTLKRDYTFIENVVRFRKLGGRLVKKEGSNLNTSEQSVVFADSTLFSVFDFPLIAGNAATALRDPNSLVIAEKIALKYFNRTDVVGEVLILDNTYSYKIGGVFKDIPDNSHFKFDFFLSMEGLEESKKSNYLSHNFNTYLLLKKGVAPSEVEGKFIEVMKKYLGPQAKETLGMDYNQLEAQGSFVKYTLFPLTKIHLHSERQGELGANGSIQFVYIFSGIAFFVLLIACINFMNLSTARSSKRAKEVGVRKVLGSYKTNLISQFLTESILLSFFSYLVAALFALLLLPYFNDLAGKEISLGLKSIVLGVPVILALVLFTGLLAGSYPAFYLSSFQPIQVLKGKIAAGVKSGWLRSSLVVFQFAMSTILIVGTLVIYNQLKYIQSKDLGYNKEQLLVVWGTYGLGGQDKVRVFKNEVLKNPNVSAGSISNYLPVPSARNSHVFFKEGEVVTNNSVMIQAWHVDHDYLKTFGIKLISGRDFSKDLATDSTSIIINEATAKLLGYEDPINRYLNDTNFEDPSKTIKYKIIGVVKNFHYESLRNTIEPLSFVLSPNPYAVTFKVSSANVKSTIDAIEKEYKTLAPELPFNYSFIDEEFDRLYRAEQRTGSLLAIFAAFAIFIACLGLFGLVTYTIEQRNKEIGIRKVLGASLVNILSLLSKEFLRLIIVALVIAIPVSWFAMNRWLNDFAYKMEISLWLFVVACGAAIVIALITISFQGVKAALANPVKSLRSE